MRARQFATSIAFFVAALVVTLVLSSNRWHQLRDNARLATVLKDIAVPRPNSLLNCSLFLAQRPFVILALGQSNSGNHAAPEYGANPAIQLMHAGTCAITGDPLPGGTGSGGSVWSLLPAKLQSMGFVQPVVLQLLAVESTSIDDWTRATSPLRQRLITTFTSNALAGLLPDLVLWQHGEADARANTSPSKYAAGLHKLARTLEYSGSRAPIMLARSTVCRSTPHQPLRAVVGKLAAKPGRFVPGPDTDQVVDQGSRFDGCHFSNAGRHAAAQLWAQAIVNYITVRTRQPADDKQ